MGLLDRIRGYRKEASQRLVDYTGDLTVPPTYMSPLVTGEVWNCDSKLHQLEVATKDAVANYICVKVAENVFDDWFIFVDEEGEETMQDVQKEFVRMKAKKWFTQALIAERTHGHSLLYTGPNVYREDYEQGYQIANLDVFSPIYFDVPPTWCDEDGRPEFVKIYPNPVFKNKFEKEPYDNFIHWITRPKGREYAGLSAMYSTWVDLTYIRLSKHSQSWLDAKHGLGLFLWYVNRLTDETEASLEDMLEEVSVSRAGIIDSTLVDKVEFVGPSDSAGGRINQSIDMLLGLVAAGSGVPKDILTGISAGAITGAEINNKALYATLNQIQKSVEPFIRELVLRMGYDQDYEIDWNTRFATDEVEQANIRLLNASAAEIEMRVEQGIGPNDMAIHIKSAEQLDQTHNQTGQQG